MNKNFAVIFDMDGVIVDSNPFHKTAVVQFCEARGQQLSEEEMKARIYGRSNKDWLRNVFGPISDEEMKKYADEKEAMFRELYKDDVEPVRGLEQFLQLLVANNIPVAIGTAAPRANVDFTLEKIHLSAYFPVVLDESHVTIGKPNPEIYINCAKALGFPPERCVVIEDSISGVLAGKSSGAKVIGITTTHTPEELSNTDYVIDDFTQLTIAHLEQLFI